MVEWKVKGIFNADAEKVYSEIGDNAITPEEILKRARNEGTELHKCFTWDDTEAAEKYRLQEARTIIRLLVVTPEREDAEPVRMYQISSTKSVYQPTKLFLEQPDEYEKLLKRAKMELDSFMKRFRQLSELEEIFEAIEKL